ncbi:MAG: hypothetical protein E7360_04660 [Clostridiales bacterium]|nr:hypothetical protein [Clostridiales bacterium]
MWITRDLERTTKNIPIFYKEFEIGKQIESGELKISALGIVNVKINGQEIEEYFMPGWTNYNKYVHLVTYDVTSLLKEGNNIIEVTLADGWYSGRLGYGRGDCVYGDVNCLFAEISVKCKDGESLNVATDKSWKVGESNIVKSSFFDGETVDFTATTERNLSLLPNAKECNVEVETKPYEYEPIAETDVLFPEILYNQNGVLRLDFKQNFAGFITFNIKGKKGEEVIIKHSEILSDDGTPYYDNLRSAVSTDKIILSGGNDVFKPKFTFHGFRYAEIYNVEGVEITDVKGIVLSQKLNYHGKFECSNPIINAVYNNAKWGQKSNFISIPTDCPQRDERLGWTGDAQVFCNSAMFNSDCNRFFVNYLRLIQADILPDGKIPSFVPFFIPVSVSTAGVPGWADSVCVIPYNHYLHYRNKEVLKENLPFAVKHFNYYLSKSENYLSKVKNAFGDWLSVKEAEDKDVISQCFFGLSAQLISKMFKILGDEENAGKYCEYYNKIKHAFRENYLYKYGKIKGDSQTVYAFSLTVGFVTVEEIKTHFIESLEREDYKLTTGFIGVQYLLPAICEIGEVDTAYKIIKQTEYPSWGYTVMQGATTIWERWNGYTKEHGFETPNMNSFNHYSLGSCVGWLYSHVLGIKLSEDGEICISPSLSAEISYAKGEYLSAKGKISVEWKYEEGRFYIDVTADKDVNLNYNFNNMDVVSVQFNDNKIKAIVK